MSGAVFDPEREARDAFNLARAFEVAAGIAAKTAVTAYNSLRYSSDGEARIAAYAVMLAAGAEQAARHADVQVALAKVAATRISKGNALTQSGEPSP